MVRFWMTALRGLITNVQSSVFCFPNSFFVQQKIRENKAIQLPPTLAEMAACVETSFCASCRNLSGTSEKLSGKARQNRCNNKCVIKSLLPNDAVGELTACNIANYDPAFHESSL